MSHQGDEVLAHLITACGFKQHIGLPEPWAQHQREKSPHLCSARQALLPGCIQFFASLTQSGGSEKSNSAPSASLAHCSSSVGLFSFTSVSTISWGLGKPGQTAATLLQKRAFAALLPAEGWCPAPEEGRYHPLHVAFAQRFAMQLCKCKTIGGYHSTPVNPSEAKRVTWFTPSKSLALCNKHSEIKPRDCMQQGHSYSGLQQDHTLTEEKKEKKKKEIQTSSKDHLTLPLSLWWQYFSQPVEQPVGQKKPKAQNNKSSRGQTALAVWYHRQQKVGIDLGFRMELGNMDFSSLLPLKPWKH